MKKILILLVLLSSAVFSQVGSASTTVNEAEGLQNEGKYNDSIVKSREASTILDSELTTTLHELMKFRIADAKAKADTAMANSKRTAVENDREFKPQVDEVNKLYAEAGAFNQAGISAGADFDSALDNYNKALGSYNNVTLNINKITQAYLNRESGIARKMIDDVRTMHDTAVKNGAIKTNDDADKLVKSNLSDAEGALVSYNFALVKQKTDAATNLINQANKTLADAKDSAKKMIDEVNAMYNASVNNNTITKGDENDKKVSDSLSLANQNLQSNNITGAVDKANEAKKMLEQINESNALLMAENKKLIEDTKKRRDDFLKSSILIIDGKDDRDVVGLITQSEESLNQNKQKDSKEKIVEANNRLNEVELRRLAPRDGDIIPGGVDEGADRNLASVDNEIKGADSRVMILPQYYVVVRKIPLTDALWRIAARGYVYGDALEWTKLYEANRRLLRDPRNPDLILPGQRLMIPSIRGERREGTYDPNKEYITIEEALNGNVATNNTVNTNTTNTNQNATNQAANNTLDNPTVR